MYRQTTKYKEICSRMGKASVAARERARLAGPAAAVSPELPELRREIIVIDHDFGTASHHFELKRCDERSDCYNVFVDGKLWKRKIGWSRILEGLRKSLPRAAAS